MKGRRREEKSQVNKSQRNELDNVSAAIIVWICICIGAGVGAIIGGLNHDHVSQSLVFLLALVGAVIGLIGGLAVIWSSIE